MVLPFWKTFWQILKMSNLELAHDPAIPLLCVNPNTCTHVYSSGISSSRNEETTQETINKRSENWYTQCSPSTQWNMTQPWKGLKLWHRLQCGCTLNTWCSAREADAKGHTVLVCLGCHSKTEGWGLQQQIGISYKSGGQTSEMKVSGWSGSGEALFLVGGRGLHCVLTRRKGVQNSCLAI